MSGLPSPSRSAMHMDCGPLAPGRLKLGAKLPVVMFEPLPVKVGSNNWPEYATSPPVVTVTGPNVEPAGTVTVRFVGLADKTFAFTAPKKTMFDEVIGLKLVPEMLMLVP